MLTIAPLFCARMIAPNAWLHRNAPSRLVPSTWRHSANEVSSAGLNTATPALFTSASTRPHLAITAAAASATESGLDTSHGTASTRCGSANAASAAARVAPSLSSRATP